MVEWDHLREGDRARAMFEKTGPSPDTLTDILKRCSEQSDYNDCMFYTHSRSECCSTKNRVVHSSARVKYRQPNGREIKAFVHALLYKWFVQDLDVAGGQRLYNHCGDKFCVNPWHFSTKRKRDIVIFCADDPKPHSVPICIPDGYDKIKYAEGFLRPSKIK